MKTALITGSTKGIGSAIAKQLLALGWKVYVNYSTDDISAAAFYDTLPENQKTNCMLLKENLNSFESAHNIAKKIKCDTKHINCVIFNCGATDRSGFLDIKKEDWENVFNVNVNVPVYILQNLDSVLSEGNGRIIFIGSVLGVIPHASSLSYGVSKAAIHALIANLTKVYASRRITVNAIAPGFIDTSWQKEKSSDHRNRIESKIALNRFGTPKEVASLCYEIINNQYINGSVLRIDGGYGYC